MNDTLLIKQGAEIASFSGGADVNTEIDTVINKAGASGMIDDDFTEIENLIDQPLLFIHGFGGTLGAIGD